MPRSDGESGLTMGRHRSWRRDQGWGEVIGCWDGPAHRFRLFGRRLPPTFQRLMPSVSSTCWRAFIGPRQSGAGAGAGHELFQAISGEMYLVCLPPRVIHHVGAMRFVSSSTVARSSGRTSWGSSWANGRSIQRGGNTRPGRPAGAMATVGQFTPFRAMKASISSESLL